VPLINKSKKPVEFKIIGNEEQFKKCCLTFTPDKDIILKPREVCSIEIRFNPKNRMPTFIHDILVQIKDNEAKKMFSV